jgi:hypothetical protein
MSILAAARTYAAVGQRAVRPLGATLRYYSTGGANTLVFVEHDNKNVAKPTLHAVAAAAKLNGPITAIVMGNGCAPVVDEVCKIEGVGKVIVADSAAYQVRNMLKEQRPPLQ